MVIRLVLVHLSTYGSSDLRGRIFFFNVQVDVEPLFLTSDALKILKNGLEMRKLWPHKVGDQELKTTNQT
jgi:hypothetical protein